MTGSALQLNVLRKEMNLYEATNKLPRNLCLMKKALLTVTPVTAEVERSFSTSGRFISRLRSRLGDRTIDALQFLKGHYSNTC